MKRVLMVCLGNICRSPLAEGILRHKANQRGIPVDIDSCGTAGYHIGEEPDPRSIEKAREYGISIEHLRGRQFHPDDLERFDHILVMDQSNYANVLVHAETEEHQDKVTLVLDYLHPGESREVPDPYYGANDGFELVYRLLDQSLEAFIEEELMNEPV